MANSLTFAATTLLIGNYTKTKVIPQSLLTNVLLKTKTIEVIDKKRPNGQVNIKAGGFGSTGVVVDGGVLPAADDVNMEAQFYSPIVILTRAGVNEAFAELADGDDGIDALFELMESRGRDCGRQLGRSTYGAQLGSITGTVAAAATSYPTPDRSGYRVGATVDFFNGTTFVESGRVTNVTNPTSGDATITFSAAFANALTGLTPYMRGQGLTANRMTSLADVTADASLYGHSASTADWHGVLDSTTPSWSNTAGRSMISRIAMDSESGRPTNILASPIGVQAIADGMVNNVRYTSGTMDPYGYAMEFDGLKVLEDANCSRNDVWFFQKNDVKLHRFREFAPRDGAGNSPSQTTFSRLLEFWGAFNLRVERRNGTGRMSGMTL